MSRALRCCGHRRRRYALINLDTGHLCAIKLPHERYALSRYAGPLEEAIPATVAIGVSRTKPCEALTIDGGITNDVALFERISTVRCSIASSLGASVGIPSAGNPVIDPVGICANFIVERARRRWRGTGRCCTGRSSHCRRCGVRYGDPNDNGTRYRASIWDDGHCGRSRIIAVGRTRDRSRRRCLRG